MRDVHRMVKSRALTSADVPALLGALTDLNGFRSTNSLPAADLLGVRGPRNNKWRCWVIAVGYAARAASDCNVGEAN